MILLIDIIIIYTYYSKIPLINKTLNLSRISVISAILTYIYNKKYH